MSGCYVVFHKQLGDTLLLEPALTRLREHHGAPVSLITRGGFRPLVQLMEGVVFQEHAPVSWRSHLYCFDPLSKSAFRALLAPAGSKRCILPDDWEMKWYHPLLFGKVIVPGLNDHYVARYFWENVPVPALSPFRPPRLHRPPETWRPSVMDGKPFVLLNPSSGWRKKSWVPERWVEVLRFLHNRGYRCLMTSGSVDWQVQHCQAIKEKAGTLVDYVTKTTMEEFLWLCSRAELVLTVDGAASHLAAAFGVRNLTLFGPTNIHNWHHSTEVSQALQAPLNKGTSHMRNLPVDSVISAIEAWTDS